MEDRDLGPLISARQKEIVTGYLDLAGQGQRIAEGQIAPDAPETGHYVAPTLLAGLAPEDRLAQEEIFGPVQVLLPFDDEDHARRIANGTPYGLVASVWSGDGGRQMRLAKRLRAGQVFLNNYGAAGGVELPFGGTGPFGPWPGKGVRGALRLLQPQDRRGASRLTPSPGRVVGIAYFWKDEGRGEVPSSGLSQGARAARLPGTVINEPPHPRDPLRKTSRPRPPARLAALTRRSSARSTTSSATPSDRPISPV
jgi:hypothetical protein